MIKSMTGFGHASKNIKGTKCLVEIRSVNHRYLDFSAKLPSILHPLESEIKEVIRQKITRGKVNLFVNFNETQLLEEKVILDEDKVKFYNRALNKLSKRFDIEKRLRLSDLVNLPSIFTVEKKDVSHKHVWNLIKPVVEAALEDLMKSKLREGRNLSRDLKKRIAKLKKAVKKISEVSKKLPEHYKARLESRIKELARGVIVDQAQIAREVAIIAEKSDITEELVRLESHLKLFEKVLKNDHTIGKRLDFVVQEINRESNTIGSKASNFPISSEVIKIKSELERIREQIQNIE